ncbi:hypothetical protein N7456_006791 [Penicillium angulare]|uniref:RING-CH-type domain-containing protein n=1 Tax=Penicillium angulare TaxID=116970 RepID=A0A9W9KC02_9EURO|nr:hypothetical protein N7456_006791 [Penicillium angulare]
MSNTPWDPQNICEMAIASQENRTCCGRTAKGTSCQNRIKLSVIQKGHQKLVSLGGRPLDLATLELSLRDIANSFLCARWHQSQQYNEVAHRWYQTAVYHETQLSRVGHPSIPPSIPVQPSEVDPTDQVTLDESRLSPPSGPSYTSAATTPSPSMGSFVTAATLRLNNVPWEISAERPAFLSCVTNIRAGVQGIELHSLRCSDDYPDIHCIFCLGEDEDNTRETVVLRCVQCSTLSHLACVEGWLEKRDTGFDTSCCVW